MEGRRAASVIVGAVLALTVACQPQGQQQTSQTPAVDTPAIRATFQDTLPRLFEEAVKAGDFDAQARIYAEDALFSAPMQPPARGRDSIRAVLRTTTPPGATADIQSMDIGILGPDRVYDFGTVTFSFTPEGTDQPQQLTATYFALFHRTPDGWKITREALSLNHPPPGGQ